MIFTRCMGKLSWENLKPYNDLVRKDGLTGFGLIAYYNLLCWWLDRFYPRNSFSNIECVLCGYRGPLFYPFYSSGSIRKNARCPECNSLERDRLVLLFLQRKTIIYERPISLLEIAPMNAFKEHFLSRSNIRYFSTDLESPLAMVKSDLRFSAFKDESFDVLICCHVLEHIKEDLQAASELMRILKKDGIGIILVPVDKTLKETIEHRKPDRRESGHVRRYGLDFPERLKEAGFYVIDNNFCGEFEEVQTKYGLTAGEDLYCVTKGGISPLLI